MKCNIPQNQKHTKKMSKEDKAKLRAIVSSAMGDVILNANGSKKNRSEDK